MPVIDLNADMGEDPANLDRDEPLLAIISSASIACGGHAGDEATMGAILSAAARLRVSVGAHPSYPDRANFGRVEHDAAPEAIGDFVREQVALAARLANARGMRIRHVKPHGALYHAAERAEVARAIAEATALSSPGAAMVGLAGSEAVRTWARRGFEAWPEGFADRRTRGGRLVPRSCPDAIILDPVEAAEQAVRLARSGECATLCVHSDTPGAVEIARAVRAALEDAGFSIASPARR